MFTNELKKGQKVRLSNGWYAELADNKKGNRRDAKVYGYVTEIGSVYSHDIEWYLFEDEDPKPRLQYQVGYGPTGAPDKGWAGMYARVEHTPAQNKLRKTVELLV